MSYSRFKPVFLLGAKAGLLFLSVWVLLSVESAHAETLTVSPRSQSQLRLEWATSVVGAKIYRKTGGGGFTEISSGISGTSYLDSGVNCTDFTYTYEVRYVRSGTVLTIGPGTGSTDACTPGPPTIPTIGSASSVDQTTATVNWTRTGPFTETDFWIYDDGGKLKGVAPAEAISGTASNLICNRSYTFHVRAHVLTNGRDYYSSASGNSNSITTDDCIPVAPSGTAVVLTSPHQTAVNVTWRDNSNNESGFYVWVSISGAGVYTGYPVGAGVTSKTITGLGCNTGYDFNVSAFVDTNGRQYFSSASAIASATTDQCTPGKPSGVSALPTGQTTATVNWTRNSPLTESGFDIRKSFPSPDASVGSAPAGSTSASITRLSCGTLYIFYVRAYVNINGRTYSTDSAGDLETTDPCAGPTLTIDSFTASPSSGTAPLNNVAFTTGIGGTATGNIRYRIDCTNDGAYDHDVTNTSNPYTTPGICNYSSAGTYTAKVNVTRQGLTAESTTNVSVSAPPSPTVDIKANVSDSPPAILYNSSATLSWTSSNATSCAASGGWSGAKATSGSESTGNLIANTTYTLTCTGAGGSALDSVTVTVSPALTLTKDRFLASPNMGESAIYNVDLITRISGTARGDVTYYFDCRDDGTFEISVVVNKTADSVDYTQVDACDYPSPGSYSLGFRVDHPNISDADRRSVLKVGVTVSSPPPPPPPPPPATCGGGVDIGLRMRQSSGVVKIAAEPAGTLTSPLRIYKGGAVRGIVLVDPSDANASAFRVRTATATKALCKLP